MEVLSLAVVTSQAALVAVERVDHTTNKQTVSQEVVTEAVVVDLDRTTHVMAAAVDLEL